MSQQARRLAGIIAAIPTPFDGNEELALDRLRSNLEKWNQTRLAGFTVLGTTGEFVSLTTDEKKRVLETARQTVPGDKVMLAGTGEESTLGTKSLSRWAGEIGYDFAIVVTPHYLRGMLTERDLVDHYQRVADASDIPVVVYHIPACTGLTFLPETIARIAEHPNICGIKDSSGDVFALQEAARLCPSEFRLLTGAAQILRAALLVGACGAILAEASITYDLALDLMAATEGGEAARASQLQARLAAFNKVLIGRYGIPGVKALLDRTGFYGGPPRGPLRVLSDEAVSELERALEEANQETIEK